MALGMSRLTIFCRLFFSAIAFNFARHMRSMVNSNRVGRISCMTSIAVVPELLAIEISCRVSGYSDRALNFSGGGNAIWRILLRIFRNAKIFGRSFAFVRNFVERKTSPKLFLFAQSVCMHFALCTTFYWVVAWKDFFHFNIAFVGLFAATDTRRNSLSVNQHFQFAVYDQGN